MILRPYSWCFLLLRSFSACRTTKEQSISASQQTNLSPHPTTTISCITRFVRDNIVRLHFEEILLSLIAQASSTLTFSKNRMKKQHNTKWRDDSKHDWTNHHQGNVKRLHTDTDWLTGDQYKKKRRNTTALPDHYFEHPKHQKHKSRRDETLSYLTVCIDYRSQQLPGPSPAVHAHHAQDLEEAKASQCRRGEDVTLATGWNHCDRGDEYNDVWGVKGGKWKVTQVPQY